MTSHPLVDGDKPLGWVAVRSFYLLNDADIVAPVDDAFELVVGIAAGRIDEVPTISARLAGWRTAADP